MALVWNSMRNRKFVISDGKELGCFCSGYGLSIEPMINMGTWKVFIDEEDGWTVITEDELPSAQWEHTFLMTETGLEILTY